MGGEAPVHAAGGPPDQLPAPDSRRRSETLPIVKAADKLSAYIKCVEELKAGNQEFESAARQTMAAMKAMDLPELTYFLEEFLPAFSLNLDQLE